VTGSDVVEQRGRPPLLPRRAGRAALVLVVLVALSAAAADWQVRRHETAGVEGCVDAALTAVSAAEGRVSFMARYVSPSLASSPPEALRRGLLEMISGAAAPARPAVRRARELCASVGVVPTHTALRRTRADCVRLLSAQLSYLTAVVEDGRHTFGATGSPHGRCAR
jgi:hypothetical protein